MGTEREHVIGIPAVGASPFEFQISNPIATHTRPCRRLTLDKAQDSSHPKVVSFVLHAAGLSFLWRDHQYISMDTEGADRGTLGL